VSKKPLVESTNLDGCCWYDCSGENTIIIVNRVAIRRHIGIFLVIKGLFIDDKVQLKRDDKNSTFFEPPVKIRHYYLMINSFIDTSDLNFKVLSL
jgi:hypothetical protein